MSLIERLKAVTPQDWLHAFALAIMIVAGSIVIMDYGMTRVMGYVPREDLQDVRATEYFSKNVVGDCDLNAGRIRILTLGRTPEEAVETWWHEYEHCYVWPKLSRSEQEEAAAYARQASPGIALKDEEEADKAVQEYAADTYAAACMNAETEDPLPPALIPYLKDCGAS